MFHLYFGAFDFFLYVPAFLFAIALANTICDELESTAISAPAQASLPLISAQPVIEETASISNPAVIESSPSSRNAISVSQSVEPAKAAIEKNGVVKRPVLRLSNIRVYRLRKKSVVKLYDLTFAIPDAIQRYQLRGEPVVYLTALEDFVEVIA